jgi:hypothetical protein
MKADADFAAWFAADVRPQLDALEHQRRQVVNRILIAWLGLLD